MDSWKNPEHAKGPSNVIVKWKKSAKKSITVTQSQIWTHMETHMHRETHTGSNSVNQSKYIEFKSYNKMLP